MHNKIIDKRATGKTEKLIHLAGTTSPKSLLVCNNPSTMAERIVAAGYGLQTIRPISYEQYIYGQDNEDDEGRLVYLDEVDMFMTKYDPMIKGYTLSLED